MTLRRFLIINPNSTAAMTDSILRVAQRSAPGAVRFRGVTNHSAPAAIEGPEDGDAAVPGVLRAIKDNPDYDGYLIACFDDTGLAEAKAMSPRPVVGIGEASFAQAAAAGPFCVVTTVPEAEPVIAKNIAATPAAAQCRGVKAAGVAVLDLEFKRAEAVQIVSAEIERQREAHKVSVVVLGCAGMGGVLPEIKARVGGALVEPVSAGVDALARQTAIGDCA